MTSLLLVAAALVCAPPLRRPKCRASCRSRLVSKVYPMRSHTVSAEGGTAACSARVRQPRSPRQGHHLWQPTSLADQDAVEAFVKEAPGELIQLEHWGCPWSRDPDGRVSVRSFGGMTVDRTLFAADKTGFHMLHTLVPDFPQI